MLPPFSVLAVAMGGWWHLPWAQFASPRFGPSLYLPTCHLGAFLVKCLLSSSSSSLFFWLCPGHTEVSEPGIKAERSNDNTGSLTTRPPGNSHLTLSASEGLCQQHGQNGKRASCLSSHLSFLSSSTVFLLTLFSPHPLFLPSLLPCLRFGFGLLCSPACGSRTSPPRM